MARRPGFTARAAVLGLVVCAVVLSLAYPLREYLSQRGEIERLRSEQAAQRQRVDQLTQRQRQLDDPATVVAEARERLHFVLPGETAYVVLDPGRDRPGASGPRPPRADTRRPWYSQLWQSTVAAGTAPPAR